MTLPVATVQRTMVWAIVQTPQTPLTLIITAGLIEAQVLRADFSTIPLERLDKKYNQQTGVIYYEANLICKLTVKYMTIVGELWWHGVCMDSFNMPAIGVVIESGQHGAVVKG